MNYSGVDLSVIIPCFNGAKTIALQLEALAQEKWSSSWEVIVADNGSTDESRAVIEAYRDRLPHLQIVDASQKRGRSHALNVGVEAASGQLLAFCDADDQVALGWLAAMGEALRQHEFVVGQREFKKLNEAWVQKTKRHLKTGLQQYTYPAFLPYGAGCCLGVRRSVHEAVGGFDETIFRVEDIDYCWRIQLMGVPLHYVPAAIVHYRLRDDLKQMFRTSRLAGEDHVKLYKKFLSLKMPRLSFKSGLGEWLRLMKRFFSEVRSREGRARWTRDFAWRLGRLQGCIKYRVLAL